MEGRDVSRGERGDVSGGKRCECRDVNLYIH